MKFLSLTALVFAAWTQAGHADETTLAPDVTSMDWVLTTVDGQPAGYAATLNLAEVGRISGQAPCNRYFADLTRTGSSFVLGPIGATKMACPEMMRESDFFQALQGVDTAIEGPGRLMLTGDGHELIFAQPID